MLTPVVAPQDRPMVPTAPDPFIVGLTSSAVTRPVAPKRIGDAR